MGKSNGFVLSFSVESQEYIHVVTLDTFMIDYLKNLGYNQATTSKLQKSNDLKSMKLFSQ